MRGFDHIDEALIRIFQNLALFIFGEVLVDVGWWLSGGRFDDQPGWLWIVGGLIMMFGYHGCAWLEEQWFLRGLEADEDDEEDPGA